MTKKVTFTLPKHIAASAAEGLLLGDFNNWNADAGIPLQRVEDGSLQTTVDLQPGQAYQYRYLLNDGRWENDDTAQYYVSADGLFVENCVVFVPEAEEAVLPEQEVLGQKELATPPAKKVVAKKTAIASKTISAKAEEKNDLTKIDGINKQVNAMLNKSGIISYAQLSKTTAKKLKEILDAGGSKYTVFDPASWPKQAKLAAAGKWEELDILKPTLKPGK